MENINVIFNTSPIINLSKIHKLFLIEKIFGKVIIPVAVYNELIVDPGFKEGQDEIVELIDKKIIIVKEVKDVNLVKALLNDLDFGESEVLALALEIGAKLIILDEMEARKKAEVYGLSKTGFIGILIKAYSLNLIDNFIDSLDLAIEKGFWINKNLYNKVKNNFSETKYK